MTNAALEPPPALNDGERKIAAVVGGLAIALAIVLYLGPPTRAQALTDCTAAPTECVVNVHSEPEVLATALVGLGGLLTLIALLGRRFTTIKGPGGWELGIAEISQEALEKASAAGDVEEVSASETPNGVRALDSTPLWAELPTWVRAQLYRWAAENPVAQTVPLPAAVVKAYKTKGQGNHPWFVQLQLAENESRTLRVGTGRGSSTSVEM
jgi:hypothetical protein